MEYMHYLWHHSTHFLIKQKYYHKSRENIFNGINHISEIELNVVLGAPDSVVRMLFRDWPNFCKLHTLFSYN